MKLIFKSAYYIFVTAILGLGLLLFATITPLLGGTYVKVVKSGSMEPFIKTGGIVVVREAASFRAGDVITFGKDTKTQIPTTHRIYKINEDGTFITKGDANNAPDPIPVSPAEVKGKVVWSAPYLGYILDFAKKPLGFILLVVVPALIVIVDEIWKIAREIGQMRGKKRAVARTNATSNVLDLRQLPRENGHRYSMSGKIMIALVLITGPAVGLSSIESTVSYYRESETSINNRMQAGEHDNTPEPILISSFASLSIEDEGESQTSSTTPTEASEEQDTSTTTPVELPVDLPEVPVSDVGVDLGSSDVTVPEESLDTTEVSPVLEEVSSE